MADILPSSIPRERRGVIVADGNTYVPCFCLNCGKRGPYAINGHMHSASYLCEPCAEIHGAAFDGALVSDEAHWAAQHQEQIEKYGRILTLAELIEIEKHDPHNTLVKLARDYKAP